MSAKEFFDQLPEHATPQRLGDLDNSFLFEIEGEGTWFVTAKDGKVTVTEGIGDADVTIKTSAEVFDGIVKGTQNPALAYMTGKVKIEGDMGVLLKLQKLL